MTEWLANANAVGATLISFGCARIALQIIAFAYFRPFSEWCFAFYPERNTKTNHPDAYFRPIFIA